MTDLEARRRDAEAETDAMPCRRASVAIIVAATAGWIVLGWLAAQVWSVM